MTTNKNLQIIKCHDDHKPVHLDTADTASIFRC